MSARYPTPDVYDPDCALDMDDGVSREKWIACRARYSVGGLVVSIIVVLVFIIVAWVASSGWTRVGVVGALVLVGGAMIYFGLRPNYRALEYQWDVHQRELQALMANGRSRADAIKELREKKMDQARLASERFAAVGQTAGLFNIASALRRQ